MSAYQRTKGHAWEREVARDLTAATGGLPHKRVLVETRDGNSGDVRCPDQPFVYQCKVGARPNVKEAVEEARAAAARWEIGVAAVKWDGGVRIAALDWDEWTAIVDCLARAAKAGVYL